MSTWPDDTQFDALLAAASHTRSQALRFDPEAPGGFRVLTAEEDAELIRAIALPQQRYQEDRKHLLDEREHARRSGDLDAVETAEAHLEVLAAEQRASHQFTDPDIDQHLAYHQLQGEFSVRLNVNRRRGNVVGRYLDLLAYGGRALGTTYASHMPAPGGGQREVTDHQPPYLSRWLGGVGLRLGSSSLALVGRYRLSNALDGNGLPQPPRAIVGIEVGWL